MPILAKKNHLVRWSSFWFWRVCKQAKLSHLRHKINFIWKDDFFFAKIGIFCKSRAGPLSEVKTHLLVNWLQLLKKIELCMASCQGFYAKFILVVCPKCSIVENDSKLILMAQHSSNILGCMHYFWLFTLWFIDEDASFFHFIHKIANIRSWRCFSSAKIRTQFSHTYCNITMIFKGMSQYFPAFPPSYSFGERIKLIICQIRHELSLIIHKISISWKKNVRWRTQYIFFFVQRHY